MCPSAPHAYNAHHHSQLTKLPDVKHNQSCQIKVRHELISVTYSVPKCSQHTQHGHQQHWVFLYLCWKRGKNFGMRKKVGPFFSSQAKKPLRRSIVLFFFFLSIPKQSQHDGASTIIYNSTFRSGTRGASIQSVPSPESRQRESQPLSAGSLRVTWKAQPHVTTR